MTTPEESSVTNPLTDLYLFDEYPLVIRPELARVIGLNGAIVFTTLLTELTELLLTFVNK